MSFLTQSSALSTQSCSPQSSIAIIQTAFIGDVVLATPLFEAARVSNPGVRIIGVVRKGCENLLENNPRIDEVIVWDKRGAHRGLGGMRHLAGELRRRNIATALIPHRSFRTAVTALMAGIGVRVGFAKGGGSFLHTRRVPYRYGIHEVERNLMLAEAAGWRSEGFRPAIFPDDGDRAAVDRELKDVGGFFAIAPGSVWPTKRWPVESYVRIGEEFASRGITAVISGGQEDADVCAAVAAGITGSANLCGRLTLRQSAELYRRAVFLLTGDTAPQHLGAAVGTRVFSIFGPTVRRFGFWPYTERGVVIEDEDTDCRPCGAHGPERCPEGTHDCMRRIAPERVIESIDGNLN